MNHAMNESRHNQIIIYRVFNTWVIFIKETGYLQFENTIKVLTVTACNILKILGYSESAKQENNQYGQSQVQVLYKC